MWIGFGSSLSTLAQPVDSLTARFIKDTDSARHLINGDRDEEAFALLRSGLRNPDRYRSPLGSLHLYYQLGVLERKVSHLNAALAALQKANRLALQLKDTTQLCRIGYTLCVVYTDQGQRAVAVEQCHRTLAYAIRPSEERDRSAVFLLLSYLYKDGGNLPLANEYGDQYVRMARRSADFTMRMLGEWHAGKQLEEKGEYRQAIASMTNTLSLMRAADTEDKANYITQMLGELAHIYRQHRQWDLAMKALQETLYWEGRYHSLAVKAGIYTEMAGVLAAQGKPHLAVQTSERGVDFARQTHRPGVLLPALDVLQQVQAQNGQYRDAWLTAKLVRDLADTLSGLAKTQAIAQIETRYKVAAKEAIIQSLQKDKAIQALQMTAHRQELKVIKQQEFLLFSIILGLAGFVTAVGYLLIRTHQLQKQTEQQRQLLESQTIELQTVNADKDKLFSIVSHDLRAPVNNIQYLLRSVQQTPIQSDAWGALIVQLTTRVDQLGRLINNLLYWSLAQQNQLRDRPEQVVLGDVLLECRTLLAETIRYKSLQVEMNGPDAYVWADEAQIQLIIRNLLDNAIKFAPAGSLITILWTSEPTGVCLDVTNEIADKTMPGAHLGIRIVSDLLQRQGGSITFDKSLVSIWRVRIHWPAQPVLPSSGPTASSTELRVR